jgi:hypothetical protein
MKYKKYYHQLIPIRVLEKFEWIANLVRPKISGYSDENLKEVISIVSCHLHKEKETAQLQIEYIKKLVPQGDKYLHELRELKIIQRSGRYENGKSSFEYCFTAPYQSEYRSLLLTDHKLIERIKRSQIIRKRESKKAIWGRSEQIKYLYSMTIADGYQDHLNSSYTDNIRKFNFAQSSLTRILNRDIFFVIDSTAGRFHSNVTNMPKGIRNFLRILGEPLLNIDLKNSQPYISTLLLTNPSKASCMTKNPELKLLLQNLKVYNTHDVRKYIELVNSGKLYEFLIDEFIKEGIELPEELEKRRRYVKNQVLRILFAKNKMPKNEINRKARQIFINRFPRVHFIFSKIRGNLKGDHFMGYQRFAILLQSIEAHLMLDIILKRISQEHPGTIAITIHDSILTGLYTNNVEAVAQIMKEEFTKFVGFTPVLKID